MLLGPSGGISCRDKLMPGSRDLCRTALITGVSLSVSPYACMFPSPLLSVSLPLSCSFLTASPLLLFDSSLLCTITVSVCLSFSLSLCLSISLSNWVCLSLSLSTSIYFCMGVLCFSVLVALYLFSVYLCFSVCCLSASQSICTCVRPSIPLPALKHAECAENYRVTNRKQLRIRTQVCS